MPIRRYLAPVCAALAAGAAGLGTVGTTAYAGVVNWNIPTWGHPVANYTQGSNGWIMPLEERVLQISDQEFQSDCRHGWTLGQIVASRHMSRARFLALFTQFEQAYLDQQVRDHRCSQQEEGWLMAHTQPNWDGVPPHIP